MIYFKCSQCNEQMEAPESMISERVQCPKCRYPEPVPEPELEEEPIRLEVPEGETAPEMSVAFQSFEKTGGYEPEREYKRPLVNTETGATRVRTFHVKLTDTAMHHLDNVINEWIDENEEIIVKFVKMTVGAVEGKKTEPHLIISVWY